MKTYIFLLLLALVATQNVYAQNEDELHIPMEEDNQFPPDANSDAVSNVIEGSGAAPVEEAIVTQVTSAPLEDIESRVLVDSESITSTTSSDDVIPCPSECVCDTEEADFVVDCSGYGLTQFPSPIDSRTTVLKLQNNKLTEIPKEISSLTNLKVLHAENNDIIEIQSGSVSELPQLVTLELANNRLIEYPKDLKNGFALTKLQEIDLGGNDMRTELTSEFFSGFTSLTKLTLPSTNQELLNDLCISLADSLKTVCTGTCTDNTYDCPEAAQSVKEGLLEATLPASIAVNNNSDPIPLEPSNEEKSIVEQTTTPHIEITILQETTVVNPSTTPPEGANEPRVISSRSGLNKEETSNSGVAPLSAIVAAHDDSTHDETTVNIGATTSETSRGGIDKSVIGIIVAGMIVVVAGIAIKKNWSSIKKRFSSSPRTPERTGATANGTTPEEVPLQDKSPV